MSDKADKQNSYADEASEESFPASDPPAKTGITGFTGHEEQSGTEKQQPDTDSNSASPRKD